MVNGEFDPFDVECNTCKFYDPMDGICGITGEHAHGYDDCHAVDKDENLCWEEWEE